MDIQVDTELQNRLVSAAALSKLIGQQSGREAIKKHGHASGQPIVVSGLQESATSTTERALVHLSEAADDARPITIFASKSKEPSDGYLMLTLDEDDLLELHAAADNELEASPLAMSDLL